MPVAEQHQLLRIGNAPRELLVGPVHDGILVRVQHFVVREIRWRDPSRACRVMAVVEDLLAPVPIEPALVLGDRIIRIEGFQPTAEGFQTLLDTLRHVEALQDFHAIHDAHALHPLRVVAAQQHGQGDHAIPRNFHLPLGIISAVRLHVLLIVEDVLVDGLAAENKRVAVLRDDAMHQTELFQCHALRLGLRWCHEVRHAE
mmetsp:Transcript_22709/g.63372  ORF Transcript_22709/g.63372 Transcript_22709/m.63372 type:complete len:201 (+) Transcript_22709:512-1114(+)